MYYSLMAICLCLAIKDSRPVRMVKVSVPEYRVRGQPAHLQCDYDLERSLLYSVKWYRNNEEFYRYIPKYSPPKHAYKLDGIKVDLSKSNDKDVWLHTTTLRSSGLYKCEVSAEAPSFASASGEGRLEVIYLPREGPKIIGNHQIVGGKRPLIFLNCTSGRSYPPATLSWDIDGEKVTDPELLVRYPALQHAHGLYTSALGLRLALGRTVQVRCRARVAPSWLGDSEAYVDKLQPFDSKEALLLVRSAAMSGSPAALLIHVFVLPILLAVRISEA